MPATNTSALFQWGFLGNKVNFILVYVDDARVSAPSKFTVRSLDGSVDHMSTLRTWDMLRCTWGIRVTL